MNVLLCSSGRRGTLTKLYRGVVHETGGKLLAGDMSSLAPALYYADEGIPLPPVTDATFVPTLLQRVKQHSLNLVVPLIDTELPVLAAVRERFSEQGCLVLVSSSELIDVCRDKWVTGRFFSEHGIRVADSWLPEDLGSSRLPDTLFVKPRDGSASTHTYHTERATLDSILALVPNPIIQEALTGPELTVDAFLDLEGRPIHYVPRQRLRHVGGESIQGVTLDDDVIGDWLLKVLEIIGAEGAVGPVTLQLFLVDGEPVLTEINPRFGGGFPLAHAAGADYPRWSLALANGSSIPPRIGDYQRGLFMTRCYTEQFMEKPLWEP